MSKGLGHTQKLVLDVLREHHGEKPSFRWVDARTVAHRRVCDGVVEYDEGASRGKEWRCPVCGGKRVPTEADVETIRRAIRTLAKRGVVEVDHYERETERTTTWWWDRRERRTTDPAYRKMLVARLTLTPEEQKDEEERHKRLLEAVAAEEGLTDS